MRKKRKHLSGATRHSAARHTNRLDSLWQVYQDLESTLKELTTGHTGLSFVDRRLKQINVSKLVKQLSESKHHVERKILKGLAEEKAILRKRLRAFVGIRKELRRPTNEVISK
ncbi:MAG: hypothetical protein HYR96_13705 [Deltaproteobacteria bacterium]|nr:hypothetical protein [Deltaproteobacteria bacterium]MBI3294714.1 hypothetical protein [Deltaproteobacteria bacterium]